MSSLSAELQHFSSKMMATAHDVAIRATLAKYFSALHDCDEAAFRGMWHPRGLLLGLGNDGSVVCRDCEAFCASAMARGTSSAYAGHDAVLSVHILDATCASAKVQIALPPAPSSPTPTTEATLYTDWLTLLNDASLGGWRIISKVYASTPLAPGEGAGSAPITPHLFYDLASAVWDGYVAAGRACDTEGMAQVFHPRCNLTFANTDGVTVIACDDFCAHVGTRWTSAKHRSWAHLKDDPRASAEDTLLSCDFASADVARVTLKIGYPPYLYHDVLLLLRLACPLKGRDGWWIVAKSSASVPFLSEAGNGEQRP